MATVNLPAIENTAKPSVFDLMAAEAAILEQIGGVVPVAAHIVAGVNDYIDFTVDGGTEMNARIAAGTYITLAALLGACDAAVGSVSGPGVFGDATHVGGIMLATANKGDVFVAVGSAAGVAARSTDGKTWVQTAIPAGVYRAVVWSSAMQRFVAVGDSVAATSPDGIVWTAQVIPPGNYKAAAVQGPYSMVAAVGDNVAAVTGNGVDWYAGVIPAGDYCGAYYSNGIYVAVGDGVAASSVNGQVWTARAIPAGSYLAVAYHEWKYRFVAVGQVGACAVSDDGINWSARALPDASTYYAIDASHDYWIAVGDVAAYTDDGDTWHAGSLPAGTYFGVSWNGKIHAAVGNNAAAYGAESAPFFTANGDHVVTASGDVAFALKFATGSHAAQSARDLLGFGAVDTGTGLEHAAGAYAPGMLHAFAGNLDSDNIAVGAGFTNQQKREPWSRASVSLPVARPGDSGAIEVASCVAVTLIVERVVLTERLAVATQFKGRIDLVSDSGAVLLSLDTMQASGADAEGVIDGAVTCAAEWEIKRMIPAGTWLRPVVTAEDGYSAWAGELVLYGKSLHV